MIEYKTIKLVILSTIFLLPLAGSMGYLIKILVLPTVGRNPLSDSGSSPLRFVLKNALIVLGLVIGVFIGSIIFRFLWFPDFPLPTSVKIAGIVLVIPYQACLGAIYGLNAAVEFGSSVSKIGNHLSPEKPKKEKRAAKTPMQEKCRNSEA